MALTDNTALAASPRWSMYDIDESNQEHDLFESTIVEACDIFGIEVYYYALNPDFDPIYGEDPNLKYHEPSLIKMIYTPGEEPSLYGQWGMLSDELIERIRVPKYTFSRDVTAADTPQIGDAIRVPWNKSKTLGATEMIYEVTHVDEEDNIFQTRKFGWELTLRPFRGSEDDNEIDQTGELDSVPISGFGDNEVFETEGDAIDNYESLPNVDELYGYK